MDPSQKGNLSTNASDNRILELGTHIAKTVQRTPFFVCWRVRLFKLWKMDKKNYIYPVP